MPAFAPVDRFELLSVEVGGEEPVAVGEDVVSVGEDVVPASADVMSAGEDMVSVDCHLMPTGIAWMTGLEYVIAVVVVGVVPTIVYVKVVAPLLLMRQGSRSYQA